MQNNSDFRLLESLKKKNSRRRLLKRALALLSAVVLLFTMNVLKRAAVAIEHKPTCEFEYDHIHTDACYDADGLLTCGLHEHTDACYQETPESVPEELEMDLEDAIDESEDETANNTPADSAADFQDQAQADYAYDMGGADQALLSGILAKTEMPVARKDVQMVGLVDDGQAGDAPVAIAMVDQDIAITATAAFGAAALAVVTEDDIYTVRLLNGAAAVPEEGEVTEAAEEAENTEEDEVTETAEEVENTEEGEVTEAADEAENTEEGEVTETAEEAEKAEEDEVTEAADEAEKAEEGEVTEAADEAEQTEEGEVTEAADEIENAEEGEVTETADEAENTEESEVTETADEAENTEEGEVTEAAEEAESTEEGEVTEEALYPAQTFQGRTGSVRVRVTADEGAFPADTTMRVSRVWDRETLDGIADAVTEDFVEVKKVMAVDIAFFDVEGNEIEPLLPISVVMTVAEIEENQDAVVVHMDDDGNAAVVEQSEAPQMEGEKLALNVELPAGDSAPAADEAIIEEETPAADEASVEEEAAQEAAGDDSGLEIVEEAVAAEIDEAAETVAFEADSFSVYAVVVTETIELKYIAQDGATYNISVGYGPEALIPAGATLSVEELTQEDSGYYLAQTASMIDGGERIALVRYFDITILDAEGNEVQPAVPVRVEVKLADEPEADVQAVHFADEGEPQRIDVRRDDEAVTFTASSFSVYGIVYTVDFHYGVDGETFTFTLPGGGAIGMRELAEALGLVDGSEEEAALFVKSIESVTFTDESLVKVVPVEMNMTVGALKQRWNLESEFSGELTEAQIEALNGKVLYAPDWALVSLKPFTSDETLTVVLRTGETFSIAVTDAQLTQSVITASGETYNITVTYGEDAAIPEDAELRAREILPGEEDYAGYLAAAKRAAGFEETDEAVEDEAAEDEAQEAREYARFFDIEIWADGQKIEPEAAVIVNIQLADAPEEEDLAVIHFEADNGPVVMQSEATSDTELRFETESFSTYGVITTPSGSQFTSGNIGDLVGKPFTLSRNGQYFKAEVVEGDPAGLQTTNEANAAVWNIKYINNGQNYILYTTDSSGREVQVYLEKRNDTSAHVRLGENRGNWFSISKNNDNTYSFQGHTSNDGSFYLNQWGGNGVLASYIDASANDHLTVKTLPNPAEDNNNYFVILKQGDEYFAVLNDGRLEQVTVDSNGKFAINIEPMMWNYRNEGNDHYLRHESYARTITADKRAASWYYSYINPNAEGGFSDPEIYKDGSIFDNPDGNYPELTNIDNNNEQTKAESKIALVNIGGKYYIKSATSDHYIGVSGGQMVGQVNSAQAAEVYFAKPSDITTWTGYNQYERMARHHVVEHIDIGVKGKAQLHVPLAPQTYYDEHGNTVVVSEIKMLTVNADVPIDSQDIKNAKLTAFQYDSTGKMVVVPNAYYITGYSGNAPTTISEAQVRYEGQFKVAWEDGKDPAHPDGGADKDNTIPNWIDACEGDADWRAWRLAHQVYYNVNLTKNVTFQLEYDGKKLYNAAGEPLNTTVPVELSGSFSYWDSNNECPAIHENFDTENGYWHTGHYSNGTQDQWDSVGWLDGSRKMTGIIPKAAWGNSGMDFILGGSKDKPAIVVSKFIEDEGRKPIALKEATTSKVQVLRKNGLDADKVKDRYLSQDEANNAFDYTSYPYDGNYYVYGGDSEGKRTINVDKDGFGTIYDFDVPAGMVGVRETDYPGTVIDENGVVWEYVRTYIQTDYVPRTNGDNGRMHITRNYGASNEKISVPEVLGKYTKDNEQEANSMLLGFYVHNVYKPKEIEVSVEKKWEQEEKPNYQPPEGSQVQVYLGRYKLVPNGDFTWGDNRANATVEIWQSNYGHNTWFLNNTDFRVGDNLTITFKRQYNEPVSYTVNGGEKMELPVYERPNGQEMLTHSFDVTVPASGKVDIKVDSFWGALGAEGRIVVKKGDKEYTSMDGGNAPDTSSEDSDMKYVVDQEEVNGVMQNVEFGPITLNGGNTWKGKLGELEAYDENGRMYRYFIAREVANENVPAGTMPIVGTDSEGSVLTSIGGEEPLPLTNKVPNFSITIQKTDESGNAIEGAEFELRKLTRGAWRIVESGIKLEGEDATAHISSLFAGRYKLTETKAPEHYIVRNKDIYFVIDEVGTASLTDEHGQKPEQNAEIYYNLINVSDKMFDVKNELGGGLQITKALKMGSDGANVDFTFTVTLKNSNGSAYTGYVSVTDKERDKAVVLVEDGSIEVTITGAGMATVDGLPADTKYTVTENATEGWIQCGAVDPDGTIVNNEFALATITNAKQGALKITKVVQLNGKDFSTETGADGTIADGTYMFSVAGPDASTDVVRYVQITVANGAAVSYRIASTADAFDSESTGNVVSGNGEWALVDGLEPGEYVVRETNKNGLELTSATVGETTTPTPQDDSVTVTVTPGDTEAKVETSNVTFTNSAYTTSIRILKIDARSRDKDNQTMLSGAKFKLLKWNDQNKQYEQVEERTTDAYGALRFEAALAAGEYQIVETEMPKGYIKVDNNDIYFTLDKAGNLTRHLAPTFTKGENGIVTEVTSWKNGEDQAIAGTWNVAEVTYAISNHIAAFTVGNNPGAALPSTGGMGTGAYTAAGAGLVLLALALMLIKRRRA